MPHPDHEKNRIAWNEMTDVHFKHPDYKVKEFLEGRSTLKSIELCEVGDVYGKNLLHLMCQFGLDTLSWARRGATVVGVDISDASIARANELKERTGLPAEFIQSDVNDLIGKIDRKFDIVFQSYGTFTWLSDLKKWGYVVAHHLKPGGVFYTIDTHPISYVFGEEPISYFDTEAKHYTNQPDYCDRTYTIKNELIEWHHPLSEIVNTLIQSGLVIELLNEFDKSYYPLHENWVEQHGYWYPPEGPPPYPLMFSLKARKP